MTRPAPHFLYSIAGWDPTGGAGIAADLKAFAAHGGCGAAAVTAVTVQDREGVHDVVALAPARVAGQIAAARRTRAFRGVKTGMLFSAAIVEAVAAALADLEAPRVVDPVLVATAGGRLLEAEALPALREALLPQADLLTPNAEEAAALLGEERLGENEGAEAARALRALGPAAVLLTGGGGEGAEAVDLLATAEGVERLALPRIEGVEAHGTGCTLSAALAARLARGERLDDAARGAKAYVHRALEAGDGWLLDHGVRAD